MSVLNTEGNKHIFTGRAKGKTRCGERRSQRAGEARASPRPSHAAQSHQVAFPCGQDRVTSPKELQAKINLFHKILGGPKIGVGVEGLLHGHTDNLEMSRFVLTLFQFLSHSLLYISK